MLEHFLNGLKIRVFAARADQRVLVDCLQSLEILESCERAVRAWESNEGIQFGDGSKRGWVRRMIKASESP